MASSELRNLKKKKEEVVDDDDRIGRLPDALLVQILSLCQHMKHSSFLNVENVVLWLYDGDECTLPQPLYTFSSLITLDLKRGFDYHAAISWKSLKSIKQEGWRRLREFLPHIRYTEISGDLYDLKCRLEDVSPWLTLSSL
ncbi:hypothetical protein HAX54_050246 [Datura stramonium]|uniref:Uncharacterized protein n=1 Tax=Datura stramonium TaxID=4076 RepID=A0ABS8WL65_DATST|nr:hypothetical protein [Datura stramonium]